jgi:DNA helicase II / ATP-dependent DNA helicase PcrA
MGTQLTPGPVLSAPTLPPDLALGIAQLRSSLRPGQQALADWQGGPLAVSAVPGAGKSTGMAVAAAIAIARYQLSAKRQLMVVTFTRSAAANIKAKIRQNLQHLGLSGGGFSVQTLHGLAWTLARSHPEAAQIQPDATLVTPTQGHRLVRSGVEQWIARCPELFDRLVEGAGFDGEATERLRRQSVLRTEVLPSLAQTVIREAKSSGLSPDDLRLVPDEPYEILAIAAGLYEAYQGQLRRRNWIDYDDMILASLRVLAVPAIRRRWQEQVFAVFEDEAQDSSPLQTQLLEILAQSQQGPVNLLRVGDPNQAINSTFTPADPLFFRQFCDRCGQLGRLRTMTQAGRSAPIILQAANWLTEWVNGAGLASPEVPFRVQAIGRVEASELGGNPEPEGLGLELHQPRDTYHSVELVGQRAMALWQHHPDAALAVLVRTHEQGRFVARELERLYGNSLALLEVGARDRASHVPQEMLTLLQFIDRPHSPDRLKAALKVLVARKLIQPQDLDALATQPEQLLYPGPLESPQSPNVAATRRLCASFLRARLELPSYELISFLALGLSYNPAELATADKLAERVAHPQTSRPDPNLSSLVAALGELVSAEAFEPIEEGDPDSRYTQPGQLTIITMHKAKGLDWDGVFLPFLQEQSLPGTPWIPLQAKFLGNFTLSDVARAQIRTLVHSQGESHPQNPLDMNPLDIPTAWQRAQTLKTAEEFRLLYVAMTRAKRLLWMAAELQAPFTWNKPEALQDRPPCPVFPALLRQFPGYFVKDG